MTFGRLEVLVVWECASSTDDHDGREANETTSMGIISSYQRLARKSGFLYVGVPLMGSTLIGAWMLAQFQQFNMEYRDSKIKRYRAEEEVGLRHGHAPRSIQDEYETLIKSGKIAQKEDDWEMKRVTARPVAYEKK